MFFSFVFYNILTKKFSEYIKFKLHKKVVHEIIIENWAVNKNINRNYQIVNLPYSNSWRDNWSLDYAYDEMFCMSNDGTKEQAPLCQSLAII